MARLDLNNEDIVIVSALRTAVGKAGGSLRNIESSTLASEVIKETLSQLSIENNQIDELILGEVRQTTAASNVARVSALRAGLKEEIPAFTVNRLCASGIQAIVSGAQQIKLNQSDITLVGGTENLSQAPMYLKNTRYGEGIQELVDSNTEVGQQPVEKYGDDLGMGQTAENVAERFDISREDQDKFSLESQRKAREAIEKGYFEKEIVPITVKQRKNSFIFDRDEHPRETSLEKLANLKPAFKKDGTVTAGNACGRNDGAAILTLMTYKNAKKLGVEPLVKIVDSTAVGVNPAVMGIGPVPAVKKLLNKTGKNIKDIDVWELNEAFASQALAVIRELGLPKEDVNRNGGAIALGHPLGATGARITTTLIHEMKRNGDELGVSTLCVGGGQGMALMLENIE